MPQRLSYARVALLTLLPLAACARPQPDASALTPPRPEGTPVAGQRPRFPEMLRVAGIARGEVRVRLATDAAGAVVPSASTVLGATHELLAAEVRKVLPTWRFRPAHDRPSPTYTVTVQFIAVADSLAIPRCERAGHPVLVSCAARPRPRELRSH
jgi:hypothetical protein